MEQFAPRLLALRSRDDVRQELQRIGVDPGGSAVMLEKTRMLCVRVSGLECRQANIIKQEMLSLGGDAAVARGSVACSIQSTDCLIIGTVKQLGRLCGKLSHQPFGLAQLGLELNQLLGHLRTTRTIWQTAHGTLELHRPLVMGILNVTPDSFSDGGQCATVEAAVDRALEMVAEGADLIDIGGESTRPGATPVPAADELARVLPVVERVAGHTSCPLSVDTWKSEVADRALEAGAAIINDISGFTFDPQMAGVAARRRAGVVLMHTRGTPQTMQLDTGYPDLLAEVQAQLLHSVDLARAAGVTDDAIVLDPGIGFGKNVAGNLALLNRLDEIVALGFPLLVGSSRKSFIGAVLDRHDPADRLFGTAATVALAVANGAAVVRVHDVRAMADVVAMTRAITVAR